MNDSSGSWQADVGLDGLTTRLKLYRYRMTPQKKDKTDVVLGPEKEIQVSPQQPTFTDELPGMSLTVYTTYDLQENDAGVISE